MGAGWKTTRPVREVRTIEDVVEIERRAYDDLVPARSLYDLFRATAALHGERMALTVLRGPDPAAVGAAFTHAELLTEATRAANLFRGLGLAPDEGVAAFLAPTLPELPALLFGAQVAGRASSINYLLSRDAIFDLLNAQGATILIVPDAALDAECREKAEGAFAAVPTLRHALVIGGAGGASGWTGLDEALRGVPGDALSFPAPTDRNQIAALFHTGGTTGRPKVVRLTHGNQIHAAFGFAQVFGYDERDVVINGFPFFHVGGTMTVGLAVLAAGGHVVVPSPYALRPKPVVEGYWRLVRAFGATVVNGVPTSIGALTNSYDGEPVPTVRMAGTGGALCPAAVGARFMERTGIRLFETYGMTETAAAIAFNPARGEPLAGSVGFRAPFSETRIAPLDGGAGPCRPGEAGLVQVRGPQVFPGYLDPAHDAGTLAPDGWLTTGDIGYLTEDERLVLTGREKDLIVRSGHNIDPAAIEDAANLHPDVEVSAAVGMPDQYAGEVPILFVVPRAGARIDLDALGRHMAERAPERPAIPKAILEIEALPVTAVGKIFKPRLRELAIEEKMRREVEALCGPSASAEVAFSTNAAKEVVVSVALAGAAPEHAAALERALRPLAQRYQVRRVEDGAG